MTSRVSDCWQINLQEGFGGGEVYTGFLVKALQDLDVRCHVLVSRRASHWPASLPAGTDIIAIKRPQDIAAQLPKQTSLLLSHGGLPAPIAQTLAASHRLTGIAHMPLYGRRTTEFIHHHRVYAVSAYVRDSLLAQLRNEQVDEFPLYGIARLERRDMSSDAILRRHSRYDWDRRKGRERLLSWLEPLMQPFLPHPQWTRRAGLTLGVVSRLTPIKQFPLLFSYVLPQLLARPDVNIDIVGAGGYTSVRDLAQILKPLGDRVRFWGHQHNVRAAYGNIDYLLTGLPEKEALGLNVIEAQACGTPVLAVDAAPFTETVADGVTGLFYRDPRHDGGVSFGQLLDRLRQRPFRIDAVTAQPYLAKFSSDAFTQRIAQLLAEIEDSWKSG